MKTVNPPRTPVTQVQAAINMEKTGEQLKIITKEKGYEVRDLMTLTGYSSQAVYKWFNGKSLPSIDTLVVLSKALNMEIMELLVIDGEFDFFATAGSMRTRGAACTMKAERKEETEMTYTEQLNKIMTQLRGGPPEDHDQWKETARQTYPLLMEMADSGGAGDCEQGNLRIALRLNLRRNILYDTSEEWKEKRTALLEAILKAVNEKRDSRTWLQLLPDSLAGPEVKEFVGKLWVRQVNQNLFPALEAEADLQPTDKLMQWYSAMLDRSEYYETRVFNRLAYFYLWYGEHECDEEKARNFFLAMERRGIAPENPYRGIFGPHGHDGMIRRLLSGNTDSDPESGQFQLLTEYAANQLAHITTHGMDGIVEGDSYNVGNVWFAWIEDPACRDLRECMRRIYDLLLDKLSEEDLRCFDDLLLTYGALLKRMLAEARTRQDCPELTRGAVFLLALLLHYDNWLLDIIDLEYCGGRKFRKQGDETSSTGDASADSIDERFFAGVREWLTAVEDLCGKDFVIGEELLVMNSLQENLIYYYAEQADEQNVKPLLEKQVYGADVLAALPRLGAEIGASYYGRAYCTHNAIALLKRYTEDGEDAKARQLVLDIAETEESLPNWIFGEDDDELTQLKKKYESLLAGEPERPAKGNPEKASRGITVAGGYVAAILQTDAELEALKGTYQPAPPRMRGDFIRFIYDHPAGTDWFGLTEERRDEIFGKKNACSGT